MIKYDADWFKQPFYTEILPKAVSVWLKPKEEVDAIGQHIHHNESGWTARLGGICQILEIRQLTYYKIIRVGAPGGYALSNIFAAMTADGKWHTEPGYIPQRFTAIHKGHYARIENGAYARIGTTEYWNNERARVTGYYVEFPEMKKTIAFKDAMPGMWVKVTDDPYRTRNWRDDFKPFVGQWRKIIGKEFGNLILEGHSSCWKEGEITEISEICPITNHAPLESIEEKGETTMRIDEDTLKRLEAGEIEANNLAKAKIKVDEDLATKQQEQAQQIYLSTKNELEEVNLRLKQDGERKDFLEKVLAKFPAEVKNG